ncbi:hypothetical protein EVAR_46681_1 [Eumeta japonica]|uniref:Uncharacterized protein n=1 Tax=Eumeta variegata TaxID=151549 RepID=A0A4C1Y2Q0_EUMVA|nr:hypothetical protein EVAR_46681_1 [Eumeta japonica]
MHEAEQLTDFETMRSIGVRVGSSEQEIRLFAAYRPPGTKMCVQDIHAIIQEQTPTLIIGDQEVDARRGHVRNGHATLAHPRDGRVRHLNSPPVSMETTRGLETIRVVLRDTAPRFLLRDRRRRRGVCQLTGEKIKRRRPGPRLFANFDVPSRRPALNIKGSCGSSAGCISYGPARCPKLKKS